MTIETYKNYLVEEIQRQFVRDCDARAIGELFDELGFGYLNSKC